MNSDIPGAAGVHRAGDAVEDYYDNERPELAALVPEHARTVLDVGCGSGVLAASLKRDRGVYAIGLELVPEAAALAERRLDLVIRANLDDITDLPLEEGSIDAAIFGDVLEHLRDPLRLLRVLRPYLARDSRIVCSIPNVRHWSVLVPLLVHDRFEYQQAGLLDRTHVHLFTLTEIETMLAEAGYEITHRDSLDIPMPLALQPIRDAVSAMGGDVAESSARFDAFQYLVVARPLQPTR